MRLVGSGKWRTMLLQLHQLGHLPLLARSSPEPSRLPSHHATDAPRFSAVALPCHAQPQNLQTSRLRIPADSRPIASASSPQPELAENGAGGQLTLTCDDYEEGAAALAIQQQQLADIEVRPHGVSCMGPVAALVAAYWPPPLPPPPPLLLCRPGCAPCRQLAAQPNTAPTKAASPHLTDHSFP